MIVTFDYSVENSKGFKKKRIFQDSDVFSLRKKDSSPPVMVPCSNLMLVL